MSTFERDTTLREAGGGIFEGTLDPRWAIYSGGGTNGGHVAAILLRAMVATVADPDRPPRSLTVHFLRPPDHGAFEVETTVERAGRMMSFVTSRLVQNARASALGMAAFGVPAPVNEFADLTMPEAPLAEDLQSIPDRDDFPFGHQLDFRPALGGYPLGGSQRAESSVWMRLREPQAADHVMVAQLLDAWAPSVFAKLGHPPGGIPTTDMTYHFREPLPLSGASDDDWYLGVFRTTTSRDGFVEEDGWLWTRHGMLVAQSRQLALLR